MTARVLNPVVLTLGRSSPCTRNLDRIKKDLFGPVNPVEVTKIFNEEVEKHQEKAIKKWGFDFRSGSPLSSNTGSQYVWERVSYNDFVPEMYTLSRAAHVRPIEPYEEIATNYDILMDERAEKANIINLSPSSSLTLSPAASSIDETDDFCDDVDIFHDKSITFKVPVPAAAAAIVNATKLTTIEAISTRKSTATPAKVTAKASTSTLLLSCGDSLRKRQPKITEYMKERKRLSQTPKKSSPAAKRMRTSSSTTTTTSSTSSSSSSINTFLSLARNSRNR